MILANLERAVQERYDVGAVYGVEPLAGGCWNQVYRVEAESGVYVLRLAHPTQSEAVLTFSHRAMKAVGLPEVHPPLADRDGETVACLGQRLASLFRFVEGERLEVATVDVVQAGELLGRIHHRTAQLGMEPGWILETLDWDRNPLWNWAAVQRSLTGCAFRFAARVREEGIDLRKERDRLAAWVREHGSSGWPMACMHGDFYPGNLIGRNGQIVAAIDWDEARVEWTFWEVGRAMWECCQTADGTELDVGRARAFYQAYLGARPPAFDPRLLGPTMRFTRLVDTLWDLTEADRTGVWDEESSEYHLANLRAMDGLASFDL